VDIDRGQLVGRLLKDIAVVVHLHEFAPVGRRPACVRNGRRLKRLAKMRENLADGPWIGDSRVLAFSINLSSSAETVCMGRILVKVVPGSSRDSIVGWLGESLKIKVQAPPEKGRANEAVVALLAKALAIDSAAITVVSGHTSPAKVLEIEGLDTEGVRQTLAEGE